MVRIRAYEDAISRGDAARADELLARVNEQLENEETSGEVTAVLSQAKANRSTIESTLGYEARRFASLLPQWRANPRLVRERLLTEVYKEILTREDVEKICVPESGAPLTIALTGSPEVRTKRRDQELKRRELEAYMGSSLGSGPYIRRGSEMTPEGRAGRQLQRDASGTGAGSGQGAPAGGGE
jgi:hypothetical protein